MSWVVAPIVARSARILPITGANLNPWPEQSEATMMLGAPGRRSTTKSPSGVVVSEAGLGSDEAAIGRRDMLRQRGADQCLIVRTHGLIVSVRIDRFIAVMMLGHFDAGLEAAIGWNAVVQAVPALDHEHRHAPGKKELRVGRLEPSHYLSRDPQRSGERRQQCFHPSTRRKERSARLDAPPIGHDTYAARARLDRP